MHDAARVADVDTGGFASIIELRAFIQAETTRLKEDIDKLFTITTAQGEDVARRDERHRALTKTIKSLQDRVDAISSAFDKIKLLDDDKVYEIVREEVTSAIDRFENKLRIEDLNRQLSETANPSGPLKTLSGKLDEGLKHAEEKHKELDAKLTALTATATKTSDDAKELKIKFTLYAGIGAVVLVKLIDFGMSLLKSVGK